MLNPRWPWPQGSVADVTLAHYRDFRVFQSLRPPAAGGPVHVGLRAEPNRCLRARPPGPIFPELRSARWTSARPVRCRAEHVTAVTGSPSSVKEASRPEGDTVSSQLEAVRDAGTVLLTTYKRDGTPVGTPVSIAFDGDRAFFRSYDQEWKTKRLRRNPHVEVAASTLRARPAWPRRPWPGPTVSCRGCSSRWPTASGTTGPCITNSGPIPGKPPAPDVGNGKSWA